MITVQDIGDLEDWAEQIDMLITESPTMELEDDSATDEIAGICETLRECVQRAIALTAPLKAEA